MLRNNGGPASIVDKHLKRRDPLDLQTGDIGLVILEQREFLALIYNQFAISPGPERAVMNLAMHCRFGWAT